MLTLFISDLVLAFTVYAPFRSGLLYTGWYWTYGAFALMTIAGKLIIRDITIKNIVIAVIVSTLIHWLVSDIGGCLVNDTFSFPVYYARLISAIPYEWRFLGEQLFTALLCLARLSGYKEDIRRYNRLINGSKFKVSSSRFQVH